MKRFLLILLSVCLLLSCLPLVAVAADEPTALPELVITEISLTANTTNNTDVSKDKCGFIEIYNTTDQPIDLGTYYLLYDSHAYAQEQTVGWQQIAVMGTMLAPHQVGVLFLQRDASVTVEQFKAYYTETLKDEFDCSAFDNALVIATGTTNVPGVLNGNPFVYGLARADKLADAILLDASHSDWTAWVPYASYSAIGAQLGFTTKGDPNSWQSIASCRASDSNNFYWYTTNIIPATSVNYIYGIDANGEWNQGQQFTAGCRQMSPGALLNWQRAQLEGRDASLVISAIMANSEDITASFGGTEYTADGYDYMTVVNAGVDPVNVFDYSIVAKLNRYDEPATTYQDAYFTHWNYLIPAEGGNIWGYDTTAANYAADMITNPARADGWLLPGESAVIWFCTEANLGAKTTFEQFRTKHELDGSVKVFAVDANTDTATGTSTASRRSALANTGHNVYGLARNAALTWENGVIVPQAITYDNGKNYGTEGVNVSDAESLVFLSYTMLTGVAGTLSYDVESATTTANLTTLAQDTPVLYKWDSIEGKADRVGAYLAISYVISTCTKVNSASVWTTASSSAATANYWAPKYQSMRFDDWSVQAGKLLDEQAEGTLLARGEASISLVGYQTNAAGKIRVVSAIADRMAFDEFGYEVTVAYGAGITKTETVVGRGVYSAINANENGTVVSHGAKELSGRDFLGALILPDFAEATGQITYTITPYTVAVGSTEKAYGTTMTFELTK